MSFSKRFISVLLILIMLLCVVFYGVMQKKEEAGEIEKENEVTTETIRVWYTEDVFTDYLTNAAVAFRENNPNIRVIPVLVEGTEFIEHTYNASISEEEDYPDIIILSNDSLEKAYLSGVATQVDKGSAAGLTHFPQAAIDAVTYHGQTIAYPLSFETSVFAYNRTYLEDWAGKVNRGEISDEENGSLSAEEIKKLEASGELEEVSEDETEEITEKVEQEPVTADDYVPDTIENLLSFANSYTVPEGVEGAFKWDVTDVFYNYFFAGKYMDVGGKSGDDPEELDIYNANAISCLEAYQNLNQAFSIDASTSNYQDVLKDFEDGKCLFTIVTSDAIESIRKSQAEAKAAYEEAKEIAERDAINQGARKDAEAMGNAVSEEDDEDEDSEDEEDGMTELQKKAEELKGKVFDIRFTRIPMINDKLESSSLSVTDCMAISGFSKHREAANSFAGFATTVYSKNLYQRSGRVAASIDANYEDEALKIFQAEYSHSTPIPKMMEASNFWVQLEITLTKIWNGEDIQTMIQNLSKQMSTQYIDPEETGEKK